MSFAPRNSVNAIERTYQTFRNAVNEEKPNSTFVQTSFHFLSHNFFRQQKTKKPHSSDSNSEKRKDIIHHDLLQNFASLGTLERAAEITDRADGQAVVGSYHSLDGQRQDRRLLPKNPIIEVFFLSKQRFSQFRSEQTTPSFK
jgi:hypothetical protein